MERFMTEYVVVTDDLDVKCNKCGHIFCKGTQNYKEFALKAEVDPSEIGSMRSTDREYCIYREFYCPGCGVMLDVDSCPPTDPILWDTRLKL